MIYIIIKLMENDKFNNGQNNFEPFSSTSPSAQFSGSQPITTSTTQDEISASTTIHSSGSFKKPINNPNKIKKIIIIIVSSIIAAATVVLVLFFTGIIGGHRIEIGDYTFVVDENKWDISINQDEATLALTKKGDILSGMIALMPYGKEITYDLFEQKDELKALINQMDNIKFKSQSAQVIDDVRCVVVNIKYSKSTYANDEAIKAFCEGKDSTMFLLQIEGENQAELTSNLSAGVNIIKTAEHK